MDIHLRPRAICALVATALMGFSSVSCIDSRYDLDGEIDTVVTVGGDYLALPLGDTEVIYLSDLLAIEDGGIVQVVNDEYHVILEPEIEDITLYLDALTVPTVDVSSAEVSIDDFGTALPSDVSSEFAFEIPLDFNLEISGVDPAVEELGSFSVEPTNVTFTMCVGTSSTIDLQAAEIRDLSIALPSFLVFADDERLSADNVLNIPTASLRGGIYSFALTLEGILFSETKGSGLVSEDGSLSVAGSLSTSGVLEYSVGAGSTGGMLLSEVFHIDPMTAVSVTGLVNPSFDPIEGSVDITGLPELFTDGDVVADIANPQLYFDITNPFGIEVDLALALTALKNGEAISEIGFTLSLSPGVNKLCISALGTDSTSGYTDVIVSELGDFLKTLPETVSLVANATISQDSYSSVEFSDSYLVDCGLKLDIPLSFGEDALIGYEMPINGLDIDLSGVVVEEAGLSLTTKSTVPLKFELVPEQTYAFDANGNAIPSITISVSGSIAESVDGVTAAEGALDIDIQASEGIDSLSGINIGFQLMSGQAVNVPLSPSQWLQFTDISLHVPGGIEFDLQSGRTE